MSKPVPINEAEAKLASRTCWVCKRVCRDRTEMERHLDDAHPKRHKPWWQFLPPLKP